MDLCHQHHLVENLYEEEDQAVEPVRKHLYYGELPGFILPVDIKDPVEDDLF